MGTFETVLRDMVTTLKLISNTTSGPARPAVTARRTLTEERAAQLDRKNRYN